MSAVAIGALIALQLFVLMPTILYSGNTEEFTTSLWSVLALYVKPALFLLALIALVSFLLPERSARRFAMVLAALGASLWLQGSFLVWDYGLLDGRPIDWQADRWRGWLDGAAWLLLLSVALFAPARTGKLLTVAAVIGCVSMGTGAIEGALERSEHLGGRDLGDRASALEEIYRFSSERNVLQLVVDGVQTDVFRDILEDGPPGRRIKEALDGFVLFHEHMGAFPFTHMSVPAILSGKRYGNELQRDRFLDEAVGVEAQTILNAAKNAGFEVDLAVSAGLEHLYARGAADKVYPLGTSLHVTRHEFAIQDAAALFDLSLFRVVPHALKRHVYNDQKWLSQRLLVTADYLTLRFFSHMAFLDTLVQRMTADRPEPVYKLMHLMVSHTPFAATPRCEYAGRVLPTVRVNVTSQARCGLIRVARLLERMKELGIYDSSTIVLMADHGAWVPPLELEPVDMADGSRRIMDPVTVAMAVPMFAVKPPRSKGPLRFSSAPSWIVDTAPTVAAMAGIGGSFAGRNALELQYAESRERFFRVYEYRRSEWTSDYLTPISEYAVNGSVFDSAAWSYRQTLAAPRNARAE
jgi:hypothetical protein